MKPNLDKIQHLSSVSIVKYIKKPDVYVFHKILKKRIMLSNEKFNFFENHLKNRIRSLYIIHTHIDLIRFIR